MAICCLLLDSLHHVLPSELGLLLLQLWTWHPYLDIIIQAAGGQEWEAWVRLQHIDHTSFVTMHQPHQGLSGLVPDEDIAAVTAADHKLTPRSVEVNPLDCGAVSVSLIAMAVLRTLGIVGVEEVNILIIVAPNQLSTIIAEHGAGDVCLELIGLPQVLWTMFDHLARSWLLAQVSPVKHADVLIPPARAEHVSVRRVGVDAVNGHLQDKDKEGIIILNKRIKMFTFLSLSFLSSMILSGFCSLVSMRNT